MENRKNVFIHEKIQISFEASSKNYYIGFTKKGEEDVILEIKQNKITKVASINFAKAELFPFCDDICDETTKKEEIESFNVERYKKERSVLYELAAFLLKNAVLVVNSSDVMCLADTKKIDIKAVDNLILRLSISSLAQPDFVYDHKFEGLFLFSYETLSVLN